MCVFGLWGKKREPAVTQSGKQCQEDGGQTQAHGPEGDRGAQRGKRRLQKEKNICRIRKREKKGAVKRLGKLLPTRTNSKSSGGETAKRGKPIESEKKRRNIAAHATSLLKTKIGREERELLVQGRRKKSP